MADEANIIDAETKVPAEIKTDTTDKVDTGTVSGDTTVADADTGPDLDSFRKGLAGEDKGFGKQLSRYTTLEDMGKAWKSAVQEAQKKQTPLTMPDEATPEQIAEYRTSIGIPEKAEDYPVSFREGYEATDADKPLLESFREKLHEDGGDPRTAAIAMDWYQDFAAGIQQDRDAEMAKRSTETQDALRAEYGGEYTGNINAANSLMKTQLGQEGFDEIMGLRFEDGTKLQDNQDFVKMMVNLGVDYYGSNGIITGDVETTAKTVDEKISEYRKLQTDNPNKYHSDEVQQEVAKLYEQKAKLAARK